MTLNGLFPLTLIFSSLLLLSCTASSTNVQFPSPRSFDAQPIQKKAQFVPVWSNEGRRPQSFGSSPQEYAGIAHIGAGDNLLVATARGKVTRLRAANGAIGWTKSFQQSFHATPTISQNRAYLPSLEGKLLAISDQNGDLIWETSADSSLESPVAVHKHYVVALDAEDVLYCWDSESGKELWRFQNERTKNFTVKGAPKPIFYDNSVIDGFAGGEVISFNLETGERLWSIDISGGEVEFADADYLAEGPHGIIYAASRQGGLYALNAANGRVEWRLNIKNINAIDVSDSTIFVATSSGRILAISPHGEALWSFKTKQTIPTSISHYGHYVIVATGQGSLYLLDAMTGVPFQKWDGLLGIHAPLKFAAERIYLHTDSGAIHTFKIGW